MQFVPCMCSVKNKVHENCLLHTGFCKLLQFINMDNFFNGFQDYYGGTSTGAPVSVIEKI